MLVKMSNAFHTKHDGKIMKNHPDPYPMDPFGWWGWNPTGSSDDLELARALLAFELLCKAEK